ncbi:MAG: PEP-CTERM sorting domain-containing protein [Cyanobacteria bacterium J06592_8]
MISISSRSQSQEHQSLKNTFDFKLKTFAQRPLTQWTLSVGIAAVTALFSLPTQAITIGQVKTQVTPYVPRDYTVLDVADGAYVPINANGQLTMDDFFNLNADDPTGTTLANVTSDAQTASNNLFSVTNPTASHGRIDTATTITGVGRPSFRNVIDTDGIDLSGGNKLTINAGRGESVFINIDGDLNLSGGSAIELTGGVKVDNVLINVSGDVSISGNSDVFGTILAVGDGSTTTLQGATIGGTLIGRNLDLADTYVDGVYLVPEPFTILGTLTATGFAAVFKKESDKKKNKDKTKV